METPKRPRHSSTSSLDDEPLILASPITLIKTIKDQDVTVIHKTTTTPQSPINAEWLGTSQFFLETNLELQKEGYLKAAIARREHTVYSINQTPYNPGLFLELCYADFNLGFHDITVANALKAILLVEAALGIGSQRFPPNLKEVVQQTVLLVIRSARPDIVYIELQDVYRKAYRALLNGLLGCGSFFDGLKQAKKALVRFPGDHELLELRACLKDGYKGRIEGYSEEGAKGEDLRALTSWGKIMVKPYPWLDKVLNQRTPNLIKQINNQFGAGNCEVAPVIFESKAEVSGLGIVAIRDINEGEVVMVDESVTGVSVISPAKFKHCDACHATLEPPFQISHETLKPSCCGKVAYCSPKCLTTATNGNGYHKILCGKDFDWIYEGKNTANTNIKYGGGARWRPIMFLRILAIILADDLPCHPLQHPLVARMAANYSENEASFWQYAENVEIPTKILIALGIDICDKEYTPEVVTTIYWRMENNANMSIMNLNPAIPIMANLPEKTYKEANEQGAVYMICLNSQYLFFNHSCQPNISWHGAIPDPSVDINWLRGADGEIHKVGSSAVFCRAARDIKKGEELKISYIGDPMGARPGPGETAEGLRASKRDSLEKWFPGGCGCIICEKENETEKKNTSGTASNDIVMEGA